jgi:hypothetical protein
VRVYVHHSLDIETLKPLESVYFDYPEGATLVRLCGGPSQAEINAQQQAAAESGQLLADFQTQFAEQQGYLNQFLVPQLQSMFLNPQGFGPTAIADLDAQLVNTTGAQALNAKQSSQEAFATQNMKGLPSGVEQAIQAQIGSAAGNTVAQGNLNIGLANQQYKNQQQMTALAGLENVPQMFGMSPQTGGLLTGANQNSFNQARQIAQQGNFWGNLGQGLLGGLIGQVPGLIAGGFGNLDSSGGSSFGEQIGNFFTGLGGGTSGPSTAPFVNGGGVSMSGPV